MHRDMFVNPILPGGREIGLEPIKEVVENIAAKAVADHNAWLLVVVLHYILWFRKGSKQKKKES